MLVIDVTREDKTIDEQFREMDIIVSMDEHCNLPITNWKGIEPSVCPLCMHEYYDDGKYCRKCQDEIDRDLDF